MHVSHSAHTVLSAPVIIQSAISATHNTSPPQHLSGTQSPSTLGCTFLKILRIFSLDLADGGKTARARQEGSGLDEGVIIPQSGDYSQPDEWLKNGAQRRVLKEGENRHWWALEFNASNMTWHVGSFR